VWSCVGVVCPCSGSCIVDAVGVRGKSSAY
jgi:hypothetical protein